MIHIPDSILLKDDQGRELCPRCHKLASECTCPVAKPKKSAHPFTPHVRIEKSGRMGKVVTLIEGLQPNEDYLKDLLKKLKHKTAGGGTFYVNGDKGTIELQGHHQDLVRRFLQEP